MAVVPTVVSFMYMHLSTKNRCFECQWKIIPFFVNNIFRQKGQLNSDVVLAGILILFSVAGAVGVGAGVEASSKAW